MDVLRILTVIRRHWFVMSLAVIIGVLAVGAVRFQFDRTTRKVEARDLTKYTGVMQLVVIDPKFSAGRTVAPAPDADQFDKTVTLAATYAELASSDAVKSFVPSASGRGVGVQSEAVQDAPIVDVTLTGTSASQLDAYGPALARAFDTYLHQQQEAAGVPLDQRMYVRMLAPPDVTAADSRGWEMGVLAFLTPVLLGFGVASIADRGMLAAAEKTPIAPPIPPILSHQSQPPVARS
jgi:hypothetical protein